MSIPITSWLRAFFALQEHAFDCRGSAEIITPDDEVIRWPRTHGGDVIAIADHFDQNLRGQPLRFGGHGLAQRWRACVDDIARFARPAEEYAHNRSFWRTLPAICVFLHSQRVALPALEVWRALFRSFPQATKDSDARHVS